MDVFNTMKRRIICNKKNEYIYIIIMKKVSLILLICFYSIATLGVSVKGFYCCGNLQSIDLSFSVDENTSTQKTDCCKTTFKFFKVNDNHFITDQNSCLNCQVALVPSFNLFSSTYFYNRFEKATVIHNSHPPPLYNGVDIYLSNRAFRI